MNAFSASRYLPALAMCLLGLAACKRSDPPVKSPLPKTVAAPAATSGVDAISSAPGESQPEPAVKLALKMHAPPVVMKGEQFALDFAFNAKPDEKSFTPPAVEGLEITTGLGEFSVSSNEMGPSAELFTYARITRTGVIELPAASIKLGGTPYYAAPVKVEVVDKIVVAPGDIQLLLNTEKTRVKIGDEVNVSLTLLSRYSVRVLQKQKHAGVATDGADTPAPTQSDIEVDEAAGLPGLAKLVGQHFEVVDVDFEPVSDKATVLVGGKRYFERNMLSLKLKAERAGKLEIGPSQLDLMVVTAQSGYFAALNGDTRAMERFPKVSVASRPVTLTVE